MNNNPGKLPAEAVDRFTKPVTRFLQIEATAGAALLLCTVLALILANSVWSASFLSFWEIKAGLLFGKADFSRSLKNWVNDGLMTFFFFIVALELKREMVLGELRNLQMAILSLAAAFGGMVVPAGLYLLIASGGGASHGWGTVMATDTAFVIGSLAILGNRIPQNLRLFLLSLAIFDDMGAILVMAIGYGGTLNWMALALAGFGLLVIVGLDQIGIRSLIVYFACGTAIWLALDASGIHPTLCGVLLGLMTPTCSWIGDKRLHEILNKVVAYPRGDHWSGDTLDRQDLRRANIATREALSPVERLEMLLHPWVAFIVLPLFALANAGVPLNLTEAKGRITWAIFIGFVVGKPLGVVSFSCLAVKLRWAELPSQLTWNILIAGALLTGIGFTMALLIAELAFSATLLNSAKLGILGASVVSAGCGLLALLWLTLPSRQH